MTARTFWAIYRRRKAYEPARLANALALVEKGIFIDSATPKTPADWRKEASAELRRYAAVRKVREEAPDDYRKRFGAPICQPEP